MGRRFGITVTLAVAALVAAPAAASAASRYAAPTSQGTGDCSSAANACPIATAVGGASSGDNILVLANLGSYNLGSSTIAPGASTTLHFYGVSGRPTLFNDGSNYVMHLTAPSSSAENLALETGGMSFSPTTGTITVDRMFATSTNQSCYFGGGVTMTNSVCWGDGNEPGGPVLETDGTNTLRNDVVWATGTIAYGIRNFGRGGRNGDDILINTIVRDTESGSSDLYANSDGTQTATFDVSYSNYATTQAAGDAALDHFNGDSTDQTTFPALVDPNTGNFHEQSTSSTINSGVTSAANGSEDLDGNPRTVNGKTDIGAYELGTPTTPPPPKTTPPHNTTITSPTINKQKHTASFQFTASGTVTGFECGLIKPKKKHHKKPKLKFSPCSSPKTYKHLGHGKYTFEVRAVNSAGPDPSPAVKQFKI